MKEIENRPLVPENAGCRQNRPLVHTTVRFATEDDAAALLAIYEPYIRNTAITFEWEVPTVEEFRSRIHDRLSMYPYLVAEQEGNIIGYAYASRFRARKAYDWDVETSIYIKQDCRRSGAGSLLLDTLERLLKKQGVLNIYAGITYHDEPDAYWDRQSIIFHTKKGYVQVAKYNDCGCKFNRWYGLLFMEKMIGEHTENPAPVIPCDRNWL